MNVYHVSDPSHRVERSKAEQGFFTRKTIDYFVFVKYHVRL